MQRVKANLARVRQSAARWWQSRARTDSKSHPILISAVATCLITMTGTWLTDRYQTHAWIREQQFEIFKQNFEGGLSLVDDLAEHMGTRFVGLNRVIWAAERSSPDGIEAVWDEYYTSVTGWNAKLLRYKGQLNRFIGPETAETFCSQVELLGVVVEDFINTATARVYERAKASRRGGREGT